MGLWLFERPFLSVGPEDDQSEADEASHVLLAVCVTETCRRRRQQLRLCVIRVSPCEL